MFSVELAEQRALHLLSKWLQDATRNGYLRLLEGAEHGDPQFESLKNVKKVLDFLDALLK